MHQSLEREALFSSPLKGYQLKAGHFLIEFTVFGGFASLNPPYKLTLVAENRRVD